VTVDQDDIDTAPIIPRDGAMSEFSSVLLQPGSTAELVLEPSEPLRDPVLFTSANPRDAAVTVERVEHGGELVVAAHSPIERYKFGLPLRAVVTRERPIKICVASQDMRVVRVGASLVAGAAAKPDGTYRLTGDEIAEEE
jgi:hypothetical protein